jgi:hypothetical protein
VPGDPPMNTAKFMTEIWMPLLADLIVRSRDDV